MRRFALMLLLLIPFAASGCTLIELMVPEGTTPTPVVQVVTATPPPTATPTQVPQPTWTPAPQCFVRTDWPVYTVVRGDTLYSIAQRAGTTYPELMTANCLTNTTIYAGQPLRVPRLPATPVPTCGGVQWFFTFSAGQSEPGCPNPVITTSAVGEDFEGGRVYYYAAAPGEADPRGTIYVIYNDGSWETYVNTWSPGMPESDPALVPPAGRYQPVRQIGKLWRENAGVRARLGWAYEPERAFTGRWQTINSHIGAPPPGYIPHFYVDHGKGIVLRLYQVNMGPNTWEVAGGYAGANPPPPPPPTQPVCTTQWFFSFKPGESDPYCPNAVVTTSAAGEDFEGGRVYWYGPVPGLTEGTIYVIYNDGTWESYLDTWQEGMPESDPTLIPPAGRYQPVRGIGKLWRENAAVRTRLGWAYEPESAFTGRFQTPAAQVNYFYIDHGKGIVLRLYSIYTTPNPWEVVGGY